jgi:predicted permease
VNPLRIMRYRLQALFRGADLARETDEEMRFHLDMAASEYEAAGLSPDEARRRALLDFGGVAGKKEEAQDARGVRWLHDLVEDVRYGFRMVRRSPASAGVIVATVALAVGATTAVYSVINGVLLRPLPYDEPDRLARIWQTRPDWTDSPSSALRSFADRIMPNAPTYFDWLERDTGFGSLGAYVDASYVLQRAEGAEVLRGQEATSGLFETLGVEPILGRVLHPDDDAPGAPRVAVLSEALWKEYFGGGRAVLGAPVVLDGSPHTVIGVMPAGFQAPTNENLGPLLPTGAPRLWTPLSDEARRGDKSVSVIGRLEPGKAITTAAEQLGAAHRALAITYSGDERLGGIRVESLLDSVVGGVRSTLWFLLSAVALVLVVASVNIANILTALSLKRRRELAVRAAVGAGSSRLTRGVLAESAVLTILGGVGGVLVAWITLPLLVRYLPPTVPRHEAIGMSAAVLLCGIAVTGITALLVGTIPAIVAARADPQEAMRASARGLTAGRAVGRTRAALVVVEVALAFVLLVGAGLLTNSYLRLWSVERGFDSEGIVAMWVEPDRSAYPTRDEQERFVRTMRDRLEEIPGVSASAANNLPLSGLSSGTLITVERPGSEAEEVSGLLSVGLDNYLDVIGIPILVGRGFDSSDDRSAPAVAIVNQTMARRYWPNGEPIGKRLKIDDSEWIEIVGVADDVRHLGLATAVDPQVYLPASQSRRSTNEVVLRARGDVGVAILRAREVVAEMSPMSPITRVLILDEAIATSVEVPRFRTFLIIGLAGLAAMLALLGVYSVLTFTVAQKTREIAVRMALGANADKVVMHVVGKGLSLTVTGVVAGLLIAWSVSDLVGQFLFEIPPNDPATYLGIVLGLLAVGCVAAYLPARRASGVDPAGVLKGE